MTPRAPGTGRDHLGPPGPQSATADADVHWPDPSPLHHWWTEVMHGTPPPHHDA